MWGATTGASIAVGPLLGGALTSGAGWRWIFFVNLPIAAAAVWLGLTRLAPARPDQARRVDWPGQAVLSLGLACLVYALIDAQSAGWTSPEILALFSASGVLLAVFAVVETRVVQPMLDVRLFRRPGFTGAQIAAFAIAASLFSLLLYFTLYLQDVLGYSAFQAGLRLMPITAVTFLVAPLAGRLSAAVAHRVLIGAGLAVVGAGLLTMRGLTAADGWTALLVGFVVSGAGSGLVNPPLGSLAVSVVEQERSGMGAGVNNTFRQVGLATGIAVFGGLFQRSVDRTLAHLLPGAPPGLARAVASGGIAHIAGRLPPAVRPHVVEAARRAFVGGLDSLFVVAAAVALAGAVAVAVLVRRRDLLSGH